MLDWGIQLDKSSTYGATTRTPAGLFWNTQSAAYEAYDVANLAHYDTGASTDARGWTHGSAPTGSDANNVSPIVLVHLKAGADFIANELEAAEAQIGFDSGNSDAGDGDTAVDHNTGGADNLTYKVSGVGVDNAVVRAYLQSDYDAGNRTVRGQATTNAAGQWVAPMYLNSGETYSFVFEKPGDYGPDLKAGVTIP